MIVFHLFYPFRCLYIDGDNVLLLFSVRHIVIRGTEYRPGCVLRLQETDDIGHDFPIYGQVEEIIIWEDEKFFIVTKLEPLSFHKQYMAYEIEREDTRVVVSWINLPWYGVLNVILKNGKRFIVKKDTSCIVDILL